MLPDALVMPLGFAASRSHADVSGIVTMGVQEATEGHEWVSGPDSVKDHVDVCVYVTTKAHIDTGDPGWGLKPC